MPTTISELVSRIFRGKQRKFPDPSKMDSDEARNLIAAQSALPLIQSDLKNAGIRAKLSIHDEWCDLAKYAVVIEDLPNSSAIYAVYLRPGWNKDLEDDPTRDIWFIDRENPPIGFGKVDEEIESAPDLETIRNKLRNKILST